jgi:hypothetical protein
LASQLKINDSFGGTHYFNLIHNIWKYFILIGWLVFNLGHGWKYLGMGTIQVCSDFLWNRFSRVIFIYFWQDLINGYVVCLSFTVNMARFGNFAIIIMLNLNVLFNVQNEMLCTKHITVFSLGNNFPIVLSCHVHYTSQHNTIGKQFPQEKTIIE